MHKQWKSGHKDKIAFSGQTKGVRRILRLISDHSGASLSGATVVTEPPDHRGAGFQDETRHRGGHLTITFCPKATRNSKHVFYFKKKSFFLSKILWRVHWLAAQSNSLAPLARADIGGARWMETGHSKGKNKIAISSQTRGDTTILRPNGDHFGQLERWAPGEGPFLKRLPNQANTWFKNFWCWKLSSGEWQTFVTNQKHVNVLSATKFSKKPGVWMSRVIHCKN